ncbi:hypothetical protein G4D95_004390 [Escherichia coli]|nr:hypothetical protein [Escherichia coli]EGZ6540149.1 hypothetical protein [Escherichia coli]
MGTYAGIGHQIKEMNSVYVVTNRVWTETPECPDTQRIKRGQRQIRPPLREDSSSAMR